MGAPLIPGPVISFNANFAQAQADAAKFISSVQRDANRATASIARGTQNLALPPATKKSFQDATAAAQNLERIIGVRLPGSVNKFIASTRLIGPALSLAFKATVVLVLIDALFRLPEVFRRAGDAIFDFGGKLRKAAEEEAKFSARMLDLNKNLADAQRTFELAGLSGLPRLRKELEFATAAWHAQALILRNTAVSSKEYGAQLKITEALAFLAAAAERNLAAERTKQAESATKKAAEAEKELNERLSENILSLQRLAGESKALDKLRESFSRTAVDLNKIQDIPIVGVPSPEEFSRRQAGLDALTKINDEWLRSTGQTVTLIELEYQRDLKNFQDIARAKGLTAEERARAELQLEQIKNKRLAEEREKGLREIKDAARQLFDAAFAGGRNFADTLRRILQAAILAPFREAFANLVARIFGPLQQRLGSIFSPRTGPGGTPVFNPNAGIGTRPGTVAVPAAQANIAAATATIANLNTLSILDSKLVTIKAASVVLAGQQNGQNTAKLALGLFGSFFGGQEDSGGSFDSIFRNQNQPGKKPSTIFSGGKATLGSIAAIGVGTIGLLQARQQGGLSGALGGAAAGALIGSNIFPGVGTVIGAIGGAIFGAFGGGKSKREIFEERIAKALKRQAVTLPEGQDFRFANLSSLSDTFGSTFAETAGGGFVASRTIIHQPVTQIFPSMDVQSFRDYARRNGNSIDEALAFAGARRVRNTVFRSSDPA